MRIIHFAGDGWYARYDDGSIDESVTRIADAVGSLWGSDHPGGKVYVGYDTRSAAAHLARETAGVLASHGLVAILSDSYCPAPALSLAVCADPDAVGGVMLTAGSLPAGNLGVLLRTSDGGPIEDLDLETIEALVPSVACSSRGPVMEADLVTPYMDRVSSAVDHGPFSDSSVSVVCDPMYGATRVYAARLLSDLGLRVSEVHGDDVADFDGMHPEAIEPWADDCEQEVVSRGADVGFLFEGSGERLGVVDETGTLVSPHKVCALVLGHLVETRGATGRVVVSQSASEYVRRQAARLGCELTVTSAGFRWLHEEVRHGGVLMGADERGGICLPGFGPARDATLTAALLAELMASTNLSLTELVRDLEEKVGHMDYGRRDVKLDAASIQALRNVLPGVNPPDVAGHVPCEVNHMDGIRLGMDDGSWVIVRPSRNEPMVRVCAEAPSVEERDALLDAGVSLARGEV
jgi:phosphomannomutase